MKRASIVTLKSKKKTATPWQWLHPILNQDDTIALIGNRIRCILPKTQAQAQAQAKTKLQAKEKGKAQSRAIEGQVISILDHQDSQLRVALLIDDEMLHTLPVSVSASSASSTATATATASSTAISTAADIQIIREDEQIISANNSSSSERQKRKYEEQIRGKDKTTIHITLPRIQTKHTLRWVIRKQSMSMATTTATATASTHVNKTSSSSSSSSNGCYIGDGNDDASQQEKNFRWVSNHIRESELLRIGEVMDVIPSSTQSTSSSSSKGKGKGKGKSLAMVLIRPLKYIEDTATGRMAHHLWNEVCDVANDLAVENGDGTGGNDHAHANDNDNDNISSVEVPIEDLIVIGKRAKRQNIGTGTTRTGAAGENVAENELMIRYRYNAGLDRFEYLQKAQGSQQLCHRCRTLDQEDRMGQCQSSHCADGGTAAGEGNKWWCKQCIRLLRKRCIFTLRKDEPFYGPCCLGQCDCKDCVKSSMVMGGESFRQAMVDSCKKVSGPSTLTGPGPSQRLNCMTCLRKCHRYGIECSKCSRLMHGDCFKWERDLWTARNDSRRKQNDLVDEDLATPQCFQCKSLELKATRRNDSPGRGGATSLLQLTIDVLDLMAPTEFSLPFNLLDNLPKSKSKPHELTDGAASKRQKKERANTPKRTSNANSARELNTSKTTKAKIDSGDLNEASDAVFNALPSKEEFQPTPASRTIP